MFLTNFLVGISTVLRTRKSLPHHYQQLTQSIASDGFGWKAPSLEEFCPFSLRATVAANAGDSQWKVRGA